MKIFLTYLIALRRGQNKRQPSQKLKMTLLQRNKRRFSVRLKTKRVFVTWS